MNVSITPAAEKFMRRMVRFNGTPSAGFRLSVSAGGCTGYTVAFTIESAPAPTDTVLPRDSVTVYVAAASKALLEGATIDFADTPTSSGLVVHGTGVGGGCASSGSPQVATISLAGLRRR